MEKMIIVTDLTRFNTHGRLCTAGLTLDGQECIRPLHNVVRGHPEYLTHEQCQQHNILPGMMLSAEFEQPQSVDAPHIEDRLYNTLTAHGMCTSEQFEQTLTASLSPTVAAGFGIDGNIRKVIPYNIRAPKSIITVEARPGTLRIVEDEYKPDRIKAHFTDQAGAEFSYLPITDLGFYDHVGNPQTRRVTVAEINRFIKSQRRVLLRVGLSRRYAAPNGRDGFWMQLNGIYSFPDFSQPIRSY